MVVVTHEG